MAIYQHSSYLQGTTDRAFEVVYEPRTRPLDTGIYRCVGCGCEIIHEANSPLPTQNHHQHSIFQGPTRWRLVVRAETK